MNQNEMISYRVIAWDIVKDTAKLSFLTGATGKLVAGYKLFNVTLIPSQVTFFQCALNGALCAIIIHSVALLFDKALGEGPYQSIGKILTTAVLCTVSSMWLTELSLVTTLALMALGITTTIFCEHWIHPPNISFGRIMASFGG